MHPDTLTVLIYHLPPDLHFWSSFHLSVLQLQNSICLLLIRGSDIPLQYLVPCRDHNYSD